MSFQTRQDAYDWVDANRPQGPCGLVVASGGFCHLFLLADGRDLLYLGMRNS